MHLSNCHNLPKVDYEYPANNERWYGLALVGEAPGKDEVKLGRPFVGRSGKLLDEILVKAKIDRSSCLVANVFRFQPPSNKVAHFFLSKQAAIRKNIQISEEIGPFGNSWLINKYLPEINNLAEVLMSLKPRMIIALGRTPFWALTSMNGLISNVGNIFDCKLVPGIPVMPTFHPSFIIRGNWSKRLEWLEHFIFAARYVAQK